MFDKLDFITEKYDELAQKVSDPEIINNQPVWQKHVKEMGEMDFTETTAQCVNRVRAMSPWPCGYVTTENGALKIWKARAAQGSGQPGTVLCADRKKGLIVATGDGAVELCEIQAPGAKRMEAKAYLLGHVIPEGQKLSEAKL